MDEAIQTLGGQVASTFDLVCNRLNSESSIQNDNHEEVLAKQEEVRAAFGAAVSQIQATAIAREEASKNAAIAREEASKNAAIALQEATIARVEASEKAVIARVEASEKAAIAREEARAKAAIAREEARDISVDRSFRQSDTIWASPFPSPRPY